MLYHQEIKTRKVNICFHYHIYVPFSPNLHNVTGVNKLIVRLVI